MQQTDFTFDLQRSQIVAERVGAQLNQCFRNSSIEVVTSDTKTIRYAEGFCVVDFGGFCLSIHHGWVVDGNTIIDPTAALWDDNLPIAYFPGVTFESDELLEALSKNRYRVPIVSPAMRHAGMMRAYAESERYAFEWSRPTIDEITQTK